MASNVDNLVLEQLRAIRAGVDANGERLDRVETRLASIEDIIGHLYAQGASDREAVHVLAQRVARIERRLELRDPD